MRLMNTSAVNYDLTNHEIIERLKTWDEEVDFDFVVIDEDRIEAYMNK